MPVLSHFRTSRPDLGLIDVDVVNGSVTTPVTLFSITVTSGDHGNISPTGETAVVKGVNQTYTVIPDPCYHVADVMVDGVSMGSSNTHAFENVTSNHTIYAEFAIDTHTITATAGANGSITPSGTSTVDCGASQEYTITPADGYHIVDALVDSNSVGTLPTYTFSDIRADHTIEAAFAVNTYTVTATTGDHGDISPTGETAVAEGGSQAFTIIPDACRRISGRCVYWLYRYTYLNKCDSGSHDTCYIRNRDLHHHSHNGI